MSSRALVSRAPAQVARQTIAYHSKSFATASALLGARLRDQTAIVYTWCRRADDAIDERSEATDEGAPRGAAGPARAGPPRGLALRSATTSTDLCEVLARLHIELDDAYAGTASDPVLAAFGEVARLRAIPRVYPADLLAGMAMDAAGTHYATVEELIAYAWRVAGVVGLMLTHVFGVRDDEALISAAHLGIAMQLTNICRDVAEDWDRGRLYVPDELLAAHGAAGLAGELARALPAAAHAPVGRAVGELLALADRYYRSGDRGVAALPWRAEIAVRAARGIYSAIGDRIARTGHDLTAGRAVVPRSEKLATVAAAAMRVALAAPVRAVRALVSPPVRVPTRTLELSDVPRL